MGKLDDGNKDRLKDLTSAKALLEQVDDDLLIIKS